MAVGVWNEQVSEVTDRKTMLEILIHYDTEIEIFLNQAIPLSTFLKRVVANTSNPNWPSGHNFTVWSRHCSFRAFRKNKFSRVPSASEKERYFLSSRIGDIIACWDPYRELCSDTSSPIPLWSSIELFRCIFPGEGPKYVVYLKQESILSKFLLRRSHTRHKYRQRRKPLYLPSEASDTFAQNKAGADAFPNGTRGELVVLSLGVLPPSWLLASKWWKPFVNPDTCRPPLIIMRVSGNSSIGAGFGEMYGKLYSE